jgi:DNA-binding MltR family transcriptional regulator
MAWKIERWSKDVFPGEENVYKKYEGLSPFELVVMATSIIDLALAELLSLRLRDDPKEYEEFLGLNEDGRAPCGSFGARIQLAYLVGIITKDDATVFRHLKRLRNVFAHQTQLDFRDPKIRTIIRNIYDALAKRIRNEPSYARKEIDFFPSYFRDHVHCSDAILFTLLGIYQLHLKGIMEQLKRVG